MNYNELIKGRKYILKRTNNGIDEIIQGEFVCVMTDLVLMKNMKKKSIPNVDGFYGFSYKTDIYYDIEKIKENSINAIKSFEQRTLDKILSRLINENFTW
jgi:hypothetical protein